jgi:protein-tyrosine-phosphatase
MSEKDKEILFICRENIGRSQMAMAYYNNHDFKAGTASSAGFEVDVSGQRLGDRVEAQNVIEAMKEEGEAFDISNSLRTQLRPEMLVNFDEVHVLSEPSSIPDWFRQFPYYFWEVEDPKGYDIMRTREVRDVIRKLIEEVVSEGQRN